MEDELKHVPLDQIIDPKFLLRLVDKASVGYLTMLDSIQQFGLITPVCLRPAGDRAPGKLEIVAGNYRTTIHRELRLPVIPALIKYNLTDKDVLAAQIRENAVRKETTKSEFAKQLKRIQRLMPGITIREMAAYINKEPQWVSLQLDLAELSPKMQRLVDQGIMPLTNGYMLAKIPKNLREKCLTQACAMPPPEFEALAAAIIKRRMEDVRDGKLSEQFNDLPFAPHAYQRPLKKVSAEISDRLILPSLLVAAEAKTPLEGAIIALKWTLNLDPASVEQRRNAAAGKKPDLKKLYEERKAQDDPELGNA